MMYKLYRSVCGDVLFDMSYNLKDILDSLASYISCYEAVDYKICECIEGKDRQLARIRSFGDYLQFKYDNCDENKKLIRK